MEEVKYIPGDLVMTDGVPTGTKKGVVYVVTASDPSKTLTLKDGTINKGVVTLDAITEEDKADFVETTTWVKHIVPIPLTPKILEDNGWKPITNSLDTKLFHKSDNFPEIKLIKHDNTFDVLVNSKTILVSLRYCHELQQLLFGLGLPSELKV